MLAKSLNPISKQHSSNSKCASHFAIRFTDIQWTLLILIAVVATLHLSPQRNYFLSSLLAVKRDIAVTILVRCMCVSVCVFPSGFVRAITPTFMHGFQNVLAQLLSLRRGSAT